MPYNRHEVNIKSARKKKTKLTEVQNNESLQIYQNNVSFNFLNDSDNYNKA